MIDSIFNYIYIYIKKKIDPTKFDFKTITKLLEMSEKIIMAIFVRPDTVIFQLIQAVFYQKLKVS